MPIHPLRLIHELKQFLTPDTTACLDVGSFQLWIAHHLYSFQPRQVSISNGQQTLGVALPWAIAAALVRPSEKILSISGDGGFLFSAMELETAVRLNAHLVHLVWVDGTYDMVRTQEELKYGRKSGVDWSHRLRQICGCLWRTWHDDQNAGGGRSGDEEAVRHGWSRDRWRARQLRRQS
jgi:acetolactate synthase I/II/III large subunit